MLSLLTGQVLNMCKLQKIYELLFIKILINIVNKPAPIKERTAKSQNIPWMNDIVLNVIRCRYRFCQTFLCK